MGQQGIKALVGIADLQVCQQLLHFRETAVDRLSELMAHFLEAEIIFVKKQLVHPHQLVKTDLFCLGNILLLFQVSGTWLILPFLQVGDLFHARQFKDPMHELMHIIDEYPLFLDL